jgi:hypothetical protein
MFTEAVLSSASTVMPAESFMGAYLEKNVQSFMDLQTQNVRAVQRLEPLRCGVYSS